MNGKWRHKYERVTLCALLVFRFKTEDTRKRSPPLPLFLRRLTTHVFVCSSNATRQQQRATTKERTGFLGRKRRKVFIRQRRINRTQRANQHENVHVAFHFERINRGDFRRDRLDRVRLVLRDDFGRRWSHRRVSVQKRTETIRRGVGRKRDIRTRVQRRVREFYLVLDVVL
jgi:hypothetical protein